jgi:hypothetical protein
MKLWVARDLYGDLNLYNKEPTLNFSDGLYYDSDMEDQYLSIDKNLFPEVTFENSPQMVELKLINNEK